MPVSPNRSPLDVISRFDRGFEDGVGLDLGAGRSPRNPLRMRHLMALDFKEHPVDSEFLTRVACDVVLEPIPCEDASVDAVYAFDFIEHIPRITHYDGKAVFPFVVLMNEIYRVLRPGGMFVAATPAVPKSGAFVDPTHVNFITTGTVSYFANECHAKTLGYGFIGEFELLWCDWLPYASAVWKSADEPKFRDGLRTQGSVFEPANFFGGHRLSQFRRRWSRKLAASTDHLLWVLRRPDGP